MNFYIFLSLIYVDKKVLIDIDIYDIMFYILLPIIQIFNNSIHEGSATSCMFYACLPLKEVALVSWKRVQHYGWKSIYKQ